MLVKFAGLVESLEVEEERMLANLEATRGLVFSQAVLLALVEQGASRDDAYRIVQRNALAAWDGSEHLLDLLEKDPAVNLSSERLTACFSIERFLANSAIVFERLEALEV
jgi:adenylosuccinate lyase